MTAETLLAPVHPLEAWRAAFADLSARLAPGLRVELEPDVAALAVRLDPGQRSGSADTGRPQLHSVDPIGNVLGGPLPELTTWTPTARGQAFRLGPDEWLVTSTDHTADPGAWESAAIAALRPHGGSATDVSAQRTGVRLRGDRARELLAFGCALDLRPRSFPAGSCAQTLLGQVGVLLAAHASGDVQVLVRTSFAGYLADRLLDAATALHPEESP